MAKILNNARARLSFPSNSTRPSGNQKYVEITIRDDDSNLQILEMEIEPEDLIRLMGGNEAPGVVRMLDEQYVHRLGKEMVISTVMLDDGDLNSGYKPKPDHPAVALAREEALAAGWESTDYRFSHGNHSLTLRKWQ